MSASAALPSSSAPSERAPLSQRAAWQEIWLVLGVSLGASALWSVLALVKKLTAGPPLAAQTTTMNASVAPDRPWLDLAYQLVGIGLGVVPALLALYLLGRQLRWPKEHRLGDLGKAVLLAAAVGLPGLAFYAAGRALGITTDIAPSGLAQQWWSVPVLILSALENGFLEEVVMVLFLFTRLRQVGWSVPAMLLFSALIRGSYHLYQGVGPGLGNVAMGVIFGLAYLRWRRVAPLVIAHTLMDVVVFVGSALLLKG